MGRLTKRIVDSAKGDPARDVFIWATEPRGFGLRIKPSGSRSYLIQYRNAHGRTRRMVIGSVGALTPAEAENLAREKLAEVAKGKDPSAERKEARKAKTVAEVCDWYLREARAGKLRGKGGRRIKASTLDADQSRIETHVKPLIGSKTVAGLTTQDIEKLQSDIAAGKTAKARRKEGRGGKATGGEAVASRTVSMLHSIFEQALRAKQAPHNPARGVRKLSAKRRKVRLSEEQITALGTAMREALAEGENPTGIRAIRSFLLTGFRRMEVLGMPRDVIQTGARGACVDFGDTKSGPQFRPIGREAYQVLRDGPESSEWAFPGDRGDGHFVGVVRVLERIVERAKIKKNVSPHVLRHTFASLAGDLGFSKLTIEGLLGHAAGSVTESYVHLDSGLLLAADRTASAMAALLDGRKNDNVVPIEAGTKSA